jgi:hypothetical protein
MASRGYPWRCVSRVCPWHGSNGPWRNVKGLSLTYYCHRYVFGPWLFYAGGVLISIVSMIYTKLYRWSRETVLPCVMLNLSCMMADKAYWINDATIPKESDKLQGSVKIHLISQVYKQHTNHKCKTKWIMVLLGDGQCYIHLNEETSLLNERRRWSVWQVEV